MLTSEYYVDNQVQSQAQNGQTNRYAYDPAGRVRQTVLETLAESKTTISHYDAPREGDLLDRRRRGREVDARRTWDRRYVDRDPGKRRRSAARAARPEGRYRGDRG